MTMRDDPSAQPRVLVVDDHPQMLAQVSSLLGTRFTLRLATSGREALAVAAEFDPDAIALDITMPGLDGFQTARALRQRGSRARIVFLSVLDSPEFVREAFACGAHGYVPKARAASDLAAALHHALAGRLFVPSLVSLPAVTQNSVHAVQLHRHRDRFWDDAGRMIRVLLQRGAMVAVIAKPDAQVRVGESLRRAAIDTAVLGAEGRYAVYDAGAVRERYRRNGGLDLDGLSTFIAELDRARVERAGSGGRAAVIGEAVGMMWQDGSIEEALQAERQWGALTRDLPFLVLCAHAFDDVIRPDDAGPFQALCSEHTAVCHAEL